ncbi:MAG: DUF3365 domain-containing protein, partial [Pseudomonadota bacterium]
IDNSQKQLRGFVLIIIGLLCGGIAASEYFNVKNITSGYRELSVHGARSIFETVVATRQWNAGHGGVYAPVSEKTPPNPYLDIPLRDISAAGLLLTKINPAYMTRQLSELLSSKNGVQIHITSLNPIRPENRADPWEQEALTSFEGGALEQSTISGTDNKTIFRFMAPLKTDQVCLSCHAKQGYRAGDIRGGISVTFSYSPFLKKIKKVITIISVSHALFLIIAIAIILFLGRKLSGNIQKLWDAQIQIKKLEGILPICSNCKKIRIEGGSAKNQKDWIMVEKYIKDRSEAEFSHGICPECAGKLYPDIYDKNGKLKTT